MKYCEVGSEGTFKSIKDRESGSYVVFRNFIELSKVKSEDKMTMNIIGFINSGCKKSCGSHIGTLLLETEGHDTVEVNIDSKKPRFFCESIGYTKVAEGAYVEVTKPANLFWVQLLVFLMFFLEIYSVIQEDFTSMQEVGTRIVEDVVDFSGNPNKSNPNTNEGNITFAGYNSLYVDDNSPIVYLMNPDVNDVYFTYVVRDAATGYILLPETGLIEPGKAYAWNVKETLSVGEYTVYFEVNTFEMNDVQTACAPARLSNIALSVH